MSARWVCANLPQACVHTSITIVQLSLPDHRVAVCHRGGLLSRHITHLQAPLYGMQPMSAALT